jgi:AcrR family transcriptional regulator
MAREDSLKARKAPKQLRSKETLDAIFEATLQVLERQERDEPSVQSIADRAGVSVGSLYQYFPSKQALARALIRFHLERRMEALDQEVAAVAGLSGPEAAARLVSGLIGSVSIRRKVEHAILRSFCRVGDLLTLTELDDRMNATVEKFVRGLGDQVRPVDPKIAAFLISNTLRTAVLLSVLQQPDRLEDPAFERELVHLVVRYLTP